LTDKAQIKMTIYFKPHKTKLAMAECGSHNATATKLTQFILSTFIFLLSLLGMV